MNIDYRIQYVKYVYSKNNIITQIILFLTYTDGGCPLRFFDVNISNTIKLLLVLFSNGFINNW